MECSIARYTFLDTSTAVRVNPEHGVVEGLT